MDIFVVIKLNVNLIIINQLKSKRNLIIPSKENQANGKVLDDVLEGRKYHRSFRSERCDNLMLRACRIINKNLREKRKYQKQR